MADKGGRPKFQIDYVKVEAMASVMCTIEEIAAELGCSHDTLSRDERFCVVYKKGMEKARASLRSKQFKLADINPTMSIWLGKQYLNQTDKVESKVTSDNVNHNIDYDAKAAALLHNMNDDERQRFLAGDMTDKEKEQIAARK